MADTCQVLCEHRLAYRRLMESSRGLPAPCGVITGSTGTPAMSSPSLPATIGVIRHPKVYPGHHGRLSSFSAIAVTASVMRVQYPPISQEKLPPKGDARGNLPSASPGYWEGKTPPARGEKE